MAALVDNRSEWELFYATPSLSAPMFFAAAAALAPTLDGSGRALDEQHPSQGSSASALLDQLAELARAVQVGCLG